ncbi:hypothetical protein I204_05313 [Kwoniella mangroviensis CBS 8886]|uniref:uncharacterized protein n=1 Tax=Kwoniella mangroviensis CBS 8507 TaxID=1296122 RepID=UPI00080D5A32|nr:hypothetical protein I204_05313 [Kwoniella mangroviensis CBS 8886]
MPDTPYHLYRLGKIGLQSKEGTIFRVYVASLAEISTVFPSMIDIAKTNHATRGNPYHILEFPATSYSTVSSAFSV